MKRKNFFALMAIIATGTTSVLILCKPDLPGSSKPDNTPDNNTPGNNTPTEKIPLTIMLESNRPLTQSPTEVTITAKINGIPNNSPFDQKCTLELWDLAKATVGNNNPVCTLNFVSNSNSSASCTLQISAPPSILTARLNEACPSYTIESTNALPEGPAWIVENKSQCTIVLHNYTLDTPCYSYTSDNTPSDYYDNYQILMPQNSTPIKFVRTSASDTQNLAPASTAYITLQNLPIPKCQNASTTLQSGMTVYANISPPTPISFDVLNTLRVTSQTENTVKLKMTEGCRNNGQFSCSNEEQFNVGFKTTETQCLNNKGEMVSCNDLELSPPIWPIVKTTYVDALDAEGKPKCGETR